MMLLFHHLYSAQERFDSYPVSFFPFAQDDVVAVALMFKNCVSLFAFISGYGLLKSIASIPLNRRSVLIWNITRLLKLLSGFWFIYALIFLVLLALSLAFSIPLDGLRKLCRYDRLIDALLHRITKKLAA